MNILTFFVVSALRMYRVQLGTNYLQRPLGLSFLGTSKSLRVRETSFDPLKIYKKKLLKHFETCKVETGYRSKGKFQHQQVDLSATNTIPLPSSC